MYIDTFRAFASDCLTTFLLSTFVNTITEGTTTGKKMITYPLKYHILTYLKFHKVAAYHKIAFHSYLMPYIWPGPE